jgi:hypothetical protein
MVTFCGGVPTASETVRLTLWWNRSLLGGRGTAPAGTCCARSGNAPGFAAGLVAPAADATDHGCGAASERRMRRRQTSGGGMVGDCDGASATGWGYARM